MRLNFMAARYFARRSSAHRPTSSMRLEKPHSLSYQRRHLDQACRETLVSVGVEDRRRRVVVEVERHQRLGAVARGCPSASPSARLLHRPRSLPRRVVSRFGDERQVDDRHVDGRHADREAVELAVQLAAAPGRPPRRRRSWSGSCSCVAERARRRSLWIDVGQHLVVGVRRGWWSSGRVTTPMRVVQRLDQRRQAVGGARGVGDDACRDAFSALWLTPKTTVASTSLPPGAEMITFFAPA